MSDEHPDLTHRLRQVVSNLARQLCARIATPAGQGARFHLERPLEGPL